MNAPTRTAELVVERDPGKFTSDDFYAMQRCGAFDGLKVELVDGGMERMAPAAGGHAVANFDVALKLAQAYGPGSRDIAVDLMIEIGETTVRSSDVAVARAKFAVDRAAYGEEVELLVEIAQTTVARDLGPKAQEYSMTGVEVYWVVDLAARCTHVMSGAGAAAYQAREVVPFGQPLTVPGSDATITID